MVKPLVNYRSEISGCLPYTSLPCDCPDSQKLASHDIGVGGALLRKKVHEGKVDGG
jgi:hypothetical protein